MESLQFQLTCEIPRIKVRAQYRSTGVLILVKASGAGEYWGEYGKNNYSNSNWLKLIALIKNNVLNFVYTHKYFFFFIWFYIFLFLISEGVKAKIYFKALPHEGQDGRTYLSADQVKMDFNVKDIQMGVDNIANGNSVIRTYQFTSTSICAFI